MSNATLESVVHMKFSPRTRANPLMHILTFCLREVGGVVGAVRYLRRCLQGLPFSFPAVFRSLMFSLLSCFFRFSFDLEPRTGYFKPQLKIQNPTLQFDMNLTCFIFPKKSDAKKPKNRNRNGQQNLKPKFFSAKTEKPNATPVK